MDDPHVIPVGEADQHETIGCPCGATTVMVERRDSSVGWLIIHERWDGLPLLESQL